MIAFLGFVLVLGAMPHVFAHQPARSTHTASPNAPVDNRESQAFLANLRARVLNNWLLPDGKNVVVLVATVNGQGDVTDVNTSESQADALLTPWPSKRQETPLRKRSRWAVSHLDMPEIAKSLLLSPPTSIRTAIAHPI
jgi:hypothetical protein